ncbi:hypothetical protein WICMUC_005331 [Wickerhamomyces mucosus]|uniref:HTH APSES-type domain-containing protein n=1 Tax=Wickerhamomyces mucosus TaxID=1378264 RepID=A0A9P8PA80_9ASCO|nr:hypothetical protein WICMUC_005331 [Wickerhamomyces mucosus]
MSNFTEFNYKINYPIHSIPNDIDINSKNYKNNSFKIVPKKYSTNIDSRSFLTVYEYQIDSNWIIWDFHNGLVFFTGLYKICNEGDKFDYLKIIDKYVVNNNNNNSINDSNFKEIEIKRIRGGFLKIQGTWIPFNLAYELSKKFAYNFRYQLIPIFGENFINDCILPTDRINFKQFDDITQSNHGNNQLTINNQIQNRTTSIKKRRFSINESITTNSTSTKILRKIRKKPRSKSDSFNVDSINSKELNELKELLNASKQLHILNNDYIRFGTSNKLLTNCNKIIKENQNNHDNINDDIFNYGGFVWKFNDDYNVKVLGKDDNSYKNNDKSIGIKSSLSTPITTVRKLDNEINPGNYNYNNYHYYKPIVKKQNMVKDVNEFSQSHPRLYLLSPLTPSTPSSTSSSSSSSLSLSPSTIPKSYNGIETILNAAQHLNYDNDRYKSRYGLDQYSLENPPVGNNHDNNNTVNGRQFTNGKILLADILENKENQLV